MLVAAVAATVGVLGYGTAIAPAAQPDAPYANCKAAVADGRYNIPRGDPAYRPPLDRDNDGFACESK